MILSDVKHVDRNNERNLYFDELRGEIKVSLQVRRINDIYDERRFAGEDVFSSDALVFAGSVTRLKRVDSR